MYPNGPAQKRPISAEIDEDVSADYREALAVADVSAKASAALSRRLLQRVLRERAGIQKRDLEKEIQEVIDRGDLPSDLAEDLDAIRHIGNFAAHPIKSTNTGEIFDVEPGEAEFLLGVLDELLDFYYVRPVQRSKKREAINLKLTEAGKPALKTVLVTTSPTEPESA